MMSSSSQRKGKASSNGHNGSSSHGKIDEVPNGRSSALAAAPSPRPAPAKKGSKRKRGGGPFRIKVGCLVAVRQNQGITDVSWINSDGTRPSSAQQMSLPSSKVSYSDVWTDPQPGRDEGFALVGKRVRCCFPKSVMKGKYGVSQRSPTLRVVEGEIVALIVSNQQQQQQQGNGGALSADHNASSSTTTSTPSEGITVDVLVDNKFMDAAPFLQRSEPKVDVAKLDPKAKRQFQMEERIRGKDKTIVRMELCKLPRLGSSQKSKTAMMARWVIRRRVPTRLSATDSYCARMSLDKQLASEQPVIINNNSITGGDDGDGAKQNNDKNGKSSNGNKGNGKSAASNGTKEETATSNQHETPTKKSNGAKRSLASPESSPRKARNKKENYAPIKYVGDGNDNEERQASNWRWLSGNFDFSQSHDNVQLPIDVLEHIAPGFVGEVVKIQPETQGGSTGSLATVTLRHLILPEQTRTGRLSRHHAYSLYAEKSNAIDGDVTAPTERFFNFPVESLVIISRSIERAEVQQQPADKEEQSKSHNHGVITPPSSNGFVISESYCFDTDTYEPLKVRNGDDRDGVDINDGDNSSKNNEENSFESCHRCKQTMIGQSYVHGARQPTCGLCGKNWENSFAFHHHSTQDAYNGDVFHFCTCDDCSITKKAQLESVCQSNMSAASKRISTGAAKWNVDNKGSQFGTLNRARLALKMMESVEFSIPTGFLGDVNAAAKSVTRVRKMPTRKLKLRKQNVTRGKIKEKSELGSIDAAAAVAAAAGSLSPKHHAEMSEGDEEPQPFRPTSARLFSYNVKKRSFVCKDEDILCWTGYRSRRPEKIRNLRMIEGSDRKRKKKESEESKTSSRAVRASQRRLNRDVSALGVSLDTLAGREQQLRFDRSGIHAWGVFADADIREGEMIIEYRGVMIGNAMAEQREKEYEAAKIGSDYMFRVDDLMVCDATKQGNMARFINASCDPNCYTKIISIEGDNRIVVYAKKDIKAGQELCYDYKFPLEYDESKRIPCHCGARDCRGYMNWDKKYVTLPAKRDQQSISISGNGSAASNSKSAGPFKRIKVKHAEES